MNQYAAGSPSREDFTEWMHLFSTSTAMDEWRDGGENKDISDAVQEANGMEEKWMFFEVCFATIASFHQPFYLNKVKLWVHLH